MSSEALSKKIQRGTHDKPLQPKSGAEYALQLAIPRAIRDVSDDLILKVSNSSQLRLSLAELLDHIPDFSMILMLEGPEEGLGLAVVSHGVCSLIIEKMTVGRCSPKMPLPRKPSKTDASIFSPIIDTILESLEVSLQEHENLVWASGFHYAAFIDDIRPLGLMLEDISYRVVKSTLSVEGLEERADDIWFVFPAVGRGRHPNCVELLVGEPESQDVTFAKELAVNVGDAQCQLNAVLAKFPMTISNVMNFSVGQDIVIPGVDLARIALEGLNMSYIANAKLGQQKGMRAVRINLLKNDLDDLYEDARMPKNILGKLRGLEHDKITDLDENEPGAVVSADTSQKSASVVDTKTIPEVMTPD